MSQYQRHERGVDYLKKSPMFRSNLMMYSVITKKRKGDQRKQQQVVTIHKTNIRRGLNMM